MCATAITGSVASLFPHVEKEWWKTVFDEFYLRTDGDVVDDPRVTETECQEILRLPHVGRLFAPKQGQDNEEPVRVLDLCCGQGRHSIWFAERYPNMQFHGYDGSTFLVNLAKKRAVDLPNVHFSEVHAGPIPADAPFDLVLLLGNSFGYENQAGDMKMLTNIFTVLKPGALFVMDIPDAAWMQSTMKDRSWEWIDGRDADQLLDGSQGRAADTLGTRLLACRERELNAARDTLACRELIIDLSNGVAKDNFYSIRLYRRGELHRVLNQCGFAVHPGGCLTQTTQSERDQDLGMMAQRRLILAQKPDFSASLAPLTDTDAYFVHPALRVSSVPGKGRRLLAAEDIAAGTLLFAAKPYALVPSIDPCRGDYLFCSNYACSKRMDKSSAAGVVVACVCIQDVAWCDADCREQDRQRHALECAWLQQYKDEVIAKYGTYDFNMLWISVRALCQRHVDRSQGSPEGVAASPAAAASQDELRRDDATSWASVLALLANQDRFPAAKRAHWSQLAAAYLHRQPFADGLSVPDLQGLICREETNSFCMYPAATGIYPRCPAVGPKAAAGGRGIPYGLALHTRGSFFNHSCLPNVMHGPDHVSRMVMHATQGIAAGQECCIAYFDLEERCSLAARRELLTHFFNFTCDCDRCQWEEEAGE